MPAGRQFAIGRQFGRQLRQRVAAPVAQCRQPVPYRHQFTFGQHEQAGIGIVAIGRTRRMDERIQRRMAVGGGRMHLVRSIDGGQQARQRVGRKRRIGGQQHHIAAGVGQRAGTQRGPGRIDGISGCGLEQGQVQFPCLRRDRRGLVCRGGSRIQAQDRGSGSLEVQVRACDKFDRPRIGARGSRCEGACGRSRQTALRGNREVRVNP